MTESTRRKMPEQVWSVGCHDCGARATGHAMNRENALRVIEEWKSEHRLRPGCSRSYTWSSIGPVKEFV